MGSLSVTLGCIWNDGMEKYYSIYHSLLCWIANRNALVLSLRPGTSGQVVKG